ncbi:YhcN/YlaJ family sporulation lipoprotein [Tuberibacillus sp. Marseille-P3662]|uniref:YhcN/YlaJ family sporulation lipoprotein n=1 Tax=Tuberibacillus sp. Marseille-P3662 TaxID=1965358 RepID=UPI000A1CB399|nr:YhcN/YlaJ family sporulation lipoprotein [Tuberibacillus sp. Marseille-P3662]
MKKIIRTGRYLIIVLCLLISAACGNKDENPDNAEGSVTEISNQQANDQFIANQTKKQLIKWEAVTGVKAVQLDKELLVALEIRQRNKFQLEPLSKKATKALEKKFPGMDVTVTTDQKALLELGKLEDQFKNGKLDETKLEKQFKKIKQIDQDVY